ncbi:MAG: SCP2 sterol-binding domain-containing protein [Lachnospirales bacterium]
MRISLINGSLPNYDFGLGLVNQVIVETLTELGEQVEIINLYEHNITFLQNDIPTNDVVNILNKIQSSDGVVFSFNTNLFAPCGIMQLFLDYLSLPMCNNILKDKNCYILSLSNQGGDKYSLDTLNQVVSQLGGFPSISSALTKDIAQNIILVNEYKMLLEKQVEDFYRFVRQSRRFFVPKNTLNQNQQSFIPYTQQPVASNTYVNQPVQNNVEVNNAPQNFVETPLVQKNEPPISNKIMQNMANSYAQNQRVAENNVNDLSTLNKFVNEPELQRQQNLQFSQEQLNDGYVNAVRADGYFNQDLNVMQNTPVVARSKTAEQMTKSLEHYFQGHLANSVTMNLFIKISGEENFEGTLRIKDNDCSYVAGQNTTADVTVMADTKVWFDILKGKVSMQKSFMTGQIKVRGNFVLLSKFDSLFKL